MTQRNEAREAVVAAADAYEAFVEARKAMNAAIPAISATIAERALYDERYRADLAALREHHRTAIAMARLGHSLLDALTPAADEQGEVERLRAAFTALHEAARGCEFDLTPTDGPIARLTLFVHENGNAISSALASRKDG